jgi:hypothetical protein
MKEQSFQREIASGSLETTLSILESPLKSGDIIS